MKKLNVTILAAASALACGCVNGNALEEFRQESEIGLYIKGERVLVFNEENYQSGFNEERNEFWVMDDNMADFFILKCHSFPTDGNSVEADLTYTTSDNIKDKSGLKFDVTGPDSSTGIVKLWSKSGSTGVIVRVLQSDL